MRKILNHELARPTAEEFAVASKIPVVVVLDNIRSLQNVGSFFRTSDAFAIESIALCGITATPPNRDIHKTALGAELTVGWQYYPTTVECVEQLVSCGYLPLVIEQVEGSIMLDQFVVEQDAKYALIFGNEVMGVDQAVVDISQGAIEIPQVGTKHSVNVSVAGGIVLWHFFCQFATKL
ncbi:MAG: TrmH family RNA methyltransferase [Rikenellaceae bacterium]